MKTIAAILHLDTSTKGTHVYKEDQGLSRDAKTFPTIYIQKHALPDPPPRTIRVTIEEEPK
jgi:hypothetical protein